MMETSQIYLETEPRFYLKFQNFSAGVNKLDASCYLRYLPCVVGSESVLTVNLHIRGGKDSAESIYATNLDLNRVKSKKVAKLV